MDCCICSPMAAVFRPPRNTICLSCYEGARCMIAFLNKLETDQGDVLHKSRNSNALLAPNSNKGISNAFKWMKEMKETTDGMNEMMGFLDGFVMAFRDEIHTDILVKASDGPPIPAHRALLATRSEVLRTMLESDEIKAPANDTISLPELNHEDVQCLLEFLYSGSLSLPQEKVDKHAFSLLIAADKYNIPFLKKFCEIQILRSLNSSNALEVLEISELCSNDALKESAMDSIVKHMEDVVFSSKYEEFAMKNSHLCVQITRVLLKEAKERTSCPSQCIGYEG